MHEILFDIITLLNCIEISIFQLVKSSILMKIWHTVIVYMYFWYTVCFSRFRVFYFLIKSFVSYIIFIRKVNIIQMVLILEYIFLNQFYERQFGCLFISAFLFYWAIPRSNWVYCTAFCIIKWRNTFYYHNTLMYPIHSRY